MRNRGIVARSAAVAAALALVVAACGGDDEGSTSETGATLDRVAFVQPLPASPLYFPSIVAEELGFVAEEGIEAVLLTAGDITEVALLDQGDADVAFTGFSEVISGLNAGFDFKVIWDGYHRAVEGVVVPMGSPIMSMDDLGGTTIGLASDSDLDFLNVALGFSASVGPDDVTTVVTGTSGGILANSLESGEIDAFAGAASDFAAMQGAGIELRFITPTEMEGNPGGSLIVATELLDERSDVLERFLRAWAKAQYVGVVNPAAVEAVGRAVVPEFFENEAVALASLEGAIGRWTPQNDIFGEVRAGAWESAVQQLLDGGVIASAPGTSEYLDDRIVAPANDFDRAAVAARAQEYLDANG